MSISPPLDRFQVNLKVKQLWGAGKLTISQGAIVLDMNWSTRKMTGVGQILHTDRDVVLVRARLAPPWFNTGLLLHSKEISACAVTSIFVRNRLRKVLAAAGFNVSEVTTLLSLHGHGGTSALQTDERPWWTRPAIRIVLAALSLLVPVILVLTLSDSPAFVGLMAVITILNLALLVRSWPGRA